MSTHNFSHLIFDKDAEIMPKKYLKASSNEWCWGDWVQKMKSCPYLQLCAKANFK